MLNSKSEIFEIENESSKNRLLKVENIDKLSKAITHFVFRSGPVESIHSKGHLDDKEMMVLNKFMVNRLAYMWSLLIQENWMELEFLINSYDSLYGHDWDKAEIDDGGNLELIRMRLSDLVNSKK